MAGSYSHVKHGWSLIENMGDAYEAVEQLMWLIESEIGAKKAQRLIDTKYYPMCRNEKPKDAAFLKVERLMEK
jgi:hypothetical protein